MPGRDWGTQSDWENSEKTDVVVDGSVVRLADAVPDSDVWYKFHDGDALDDSGNGNDGTAEGDYTYTADGIQFGGAYTGDRVYSPDIGLNNDDTATIGTNIIPDTDLSSGAAGRTWCSVHAGNNCWVLGYEGGDIVLQAINTTNVAGTLRYTVDLSQDVEYTVGAKSDAGDWTIFLNGDAVATSSEGTGPSVANSGAFYISASVGSNGALQDVGSSSTFADSWAANRAVADSEMPG